ncbi:BspA family leucine-rich repeat surface protein [Fulvivirga ligni]|uniref:BspA family leucine-rich repeat surface protein n=1 Tax=Fulvivirga ligni TaxID=2904246 RepID=UPI001F167C06|nr:BspA family leucine-rich repeat surface protein [Fulvivirga ligni]UII20610.1 BspA family leucine-rich repeat surface protein [Fulvivirga ligni]
MKKEVVFVLLMLITFMWIGCSEDDPVTPPLPPNTDEPNPELEPIVITAKDFQTTIDENPESGTVLGKIEASASRDSLAFKLYNIKPYGSLTIDSVTGELMVKEATLFDFEKNETIISTVVITAKDSTQAEIQAVINLKDLDDPKSFITTWVTTQQNEEIIIPVNNWTYSYNYTVDWGDGQVTMNHTDDAFHTYKEAGEHQVEITGIFPAIFFQKLLWGKTAYARKLVSIDQWGDNEWASFEGAFSIGYNLKANFKDAPNLKNVTKLNGMFSSTKIDCDLNSWDMSHIEQIDSMFSHNEVFNGDISQWDVSNVKSMHRVFNGAESFNQDINQWDVSNVQDMSQMFKYAKDFNQDLNQWNVSSVTNMYEMFNYCAAFNGDICDWDVSNVQRMSGMFYSANSFNQNIGSWEIGSVTDLYTMFFEANSFNQDLSSWNISNVERMYLIFGSSLSTTNYDNTLEGWSKQDVKEGVHLVTSGQKYCSKGESARAILTSKGWTITGDEKAEDCE